MNTAFIFSGLSSKSASAKHRRDSPSEGSCACSQLDDDDGVGEFFPILPHLHHHHYLHRPEIVVPFLRPVRGHFRRIICPARQWREQDGHFAGPLATARRAEETNKMVDKKQRTVQPHGPRHGELKQFMANLWIIFSDKRIYGRR